MKDITSVIIYQDDVSPLNNTKVIFRGTYKAANDFFLNYIKEKGYGVKDITYYEDGDKKIGSITTKNLIKLQT